MSLYVSVVDSIPVQYFITSDSKRIAEYVHRERALERVKRLQAGEDQVPALVRIEDYLSLAQEILSGQVATAVPPTLQILCALTMALLKAKERSDRRAGWCETVAR